MTFKGKLYPFQLEASQFMMDRSQTLVALVMGAGKTVTSLATLESLHEDGDIDRCLLVVPSSLKYQWAAEIRKFTDSSFLIIEGTPKKRAELWRRTHNNLYTIVNAELLIKDETLLKNLRFDVVVVDEATIIKSITSARSKVIKRIGKRSPYRFALTGQPIENRPEELFSIMQFVDATVLGKYNEFESQYVVRDYFGKPVNYKNLHRLQEIMKGVMVRKTREDIADQLPRVVSTVVPITFDRLGAECYQKIADDLLVTIQEAVAKHGKGFDLWSHYHEEGNEAKGEIMARLTVLRMLCDDPKLVHLSAAAYNDPNNTAGSRYAAEVLERGWLPALAGSPKLDAVRGYCDEILSEDPSNKIVIFSFFKANLRLLQQALEGSTKSVLFMGGMTSEAKDKAKTQFQTDTNTRVFLSSDAGGYGVDLPMANYLLSYDLPWSAGKLDQREARIIRLSSEFPHITLASFVMRGSIEERQYEMLIQKRDINSAFIDGKHDSQGNLSLSLGSLSEYLRNTEGLL
jgi:SNF2 family DNA or RNA helicase